MAKFLSKDGKFFSKDGKLVKRKPLANKGDLINMDLGNGNKTYRVLTNDDDIVQVIAMYHLDGNKRFNSTDRSITVNNFTIQPYSGSDLDTYLNTTWYNTLNNEAKTAIVSRNLTQDIWDWNWESSSALGNPVITGTELFSGQSKKSYTISKCGEIDIGNRNIYALSVQDVINYLQNNPTLPDSSTMLSEINISSLFWNVTVLPGHSSLWKPFWFRTAEATKASGGYGFLPNTYSGGLENNPTMGGAGIDYYPRPAFCIDLNKIPFIKTTEVIT